MADGGEGTLDVLARAIPAAQWRTAPGCTGPDGRPVEAPQAIGGACAGGAGAQDQHARGHAALRIESAEDSVARGPPARRGRSSHQKPPASSPPAISTLCQASETTTP